MNGLHGSGLVARAEAGARELFALITDHAPGLALVSDLVPLLNLDRSDGRAWLSASVLVGTIPVRPTIPGLDGRIA
jgi:hypothetical protein